MVNENNGKFEVTCIIDSRKWQKMPHLWAKTGLNQMLDLLNLKL